MPTELSTQQTIVPSFESVVARESFDERNRALFFRSTGQIATTLADALPADASITVSHPAVATHPNHDFYGERYSDGGAPVLYLFSTEFDQYELVEQLWEHEGVRTQAELGQSFGFD